MVYKTQDKIFAIVWVALVPVALALAIFIFLILCTTRRKTVDMVTSSLLVSRLVHCAGAVLMAALFKLEQWMWSRTECHILMWFWITAWASDFLTALFFLMFYSGRVARKSPRSTCYVTFIFLFSWILAIVAGGLPPLFPGIFQNFEDEICSVGLTTAGNPVPQATIPILIVGFLLLVVLIIALIAETQSKILIYWTSLKAEQRRETVNSERSPEDKSAESAEAENYEKYWIQENGDAPKVIKPRQGHVPGRDSDSTDSGNSRESTPWIRSERSMKDVRNIVVTAGSFSILCDVIPQLVN